MGEIIERASWAGEDRLHGTASVGTRNLDADTIRFFDVQHADRLNIDGDEIGPKEWARQLYDLHTAGQRREDIIPHYLVSYDGTVLEGRTPDQEPGAGEPGTILVMVEAPLHGGLTDEQASSVIGLKAHWEAQLGKELWAKGLPVQTVTVVRDPEEEADLVDELESKNTELKAAADAAVAEADAAKTAAETAETERVAAEDRIADLEAQLAERDALIEERLAAGENVEPKPIEEVAAAQVEAENAGAAADAAASEEAAQVADSAPGSEDPFGS